MVLLPPPRGFIFESSTFLQPTIFKNDQVPLRKRLTASAATTANALRTTAPTSAALTTSIAETRTTITSTATITTSIPEIMLILVVTIMSTRASITTTTPSTKHTKRLPNLLKKKIGILLINTGTPKDLKYWTIYRYLQEFLHDRRVIELTRFLWCPILHFFILPFKPLKKQKTYGSIWNKVTDESPLRTIIKSQSKLLRERFDRRDDIIVDWAFRFGGPSIEEKVQALREQGCDRLISIPLFPHYSATTMASCQDQVFRALMKQRDQMSVHTITPYYTDKTFLSSIASSIQKSLQEHSSIHFDMLLFSYHGIPLSYEQKGDPYGSQCRKTTELIKETLRLDIPIGTCFQSRFGYSEWLKPYTDDLVVQQAKLGMKNILIVTPGFSTDCLETLEEIAIELKNDFLKHGGENLIFVPCLNDSREGIDVIATVALKALQSFT
ncbi:unnamed protein product [Caenorhabditis auriculariae]|uniref:Ferrochelatase n=1 Tax=Caenorhabditis auriculariae TaxID=2777116 RepID=A0A8S1HAG0_9PELO|nr:unnamed protein product [Caenorhabditis auriculariae]